jgi:hypothetical protein
MKMEQIECSETSAYKIKTPGNHPEGNIQHTEHGESLKSKKEKLVNFQAAECDYGCNATESRCRNNSTGL